MSFNFRWPGTGRSGNYCKTCGCTRAGCTCGCCQNSTGPCKLQIIIAGIENFVCTTCADLNGTYLVPAACAGSLTLPKTPCGHSYSLGVSITCNLSGTTLTVSFSDLAFGLPLVVFKASIGGFPADCFAIDQNIPIHTAGFPSEWDNGQSSNCQLLHTPGISCHAKAV